MIDGVTGRTPELFEGRSSGRYAAERVQAVLERLLAEAPEMEAAEILAAVTADLHAVYRRLGLLERAAAPNQRFGATLALFRHRRDGDEVLLVGDSGVRLDGGAVMQVDKPLDAITASLRVAAWHDLAARGHDRETCNRLGRQIVFQGAGQGTGALEGLFDAARLAAIADRAVAASAARFPAVPRAAIAALVQGGIANGQFVHQNNPESPLGYSGVDGFAIPPALVTAARPPARAARVELFSDGYFSHPPGFGVQAWEAAAEEVERIDPDKVAAYASVKGSQGAVRTDDRTYVGVEITSPAPARAASPAPAPG